MENQEPLSEGFKGFDLNFFKALDSAEEMDEYAEKYLPLLGEGSSRKVYRWKAGKVLKIDYLDGVFDPGEQNKNEIAAYTKPGMSDLLSKIIDFDSKKYRWLIAESVKVFADNADLMAKITPSEIMMRTINYEADALSFEETMEAALAQQNKNWQTAFGHHTARPLQMNDFNALDMELFRKLYEASNLDLDDIARYDHWGMTSSGSVVLVDYGFADDSPMV